MADKSVGLFKAWADQHKRLIALEDAGGGDTPVGAERLRQVRAEADRMRQEALAAFHGELQARGLRA
jgi:hypothetical protein